MENNIKKTRILDALNEKIQLLFAILKIAKEQVQLIEDDDTDVLLEKIEVRKKFIQRILDIEKGIVEEGLKSHPAYSTVDVQAKLTEIKEIHSNIKVLDEKNCNLAESKVAEYKQQIREINGDKNRLSSYNNYADNSDGIYFDKKK